MTKSRLLISRSSVCSLEQRGMSFLEVLVAILMLVVFTGVVVMVMEFTFRFIGKAESGERTQLDVSNGVLIDHQEIQLVMDQIVELLSQPGLTKQRLLGNEPGKPQIAFDLFADSPQTACPAFDPISAWALPRGSISPPGDRLLPPGYRLCVWQTTAKEPSLGELADGAKPGIYLLQALPERLSSSTLPTRRLFCRPRPFC